MTDFPAAHSMDTTWFAIDRDGNVAVFETGESGCVPTEAYLGEDFGPLEDALRTLPPTAVRYDLEGQRAMSHTPHLELLPHLVEQYERLVFVDAIAPVRDLMTRLDAEEVAATTGAAFRCGAKDPAALAELHARGACLGCFMILDGEEADLAGHGAYRYEHTCDNWISGPYARAAVPAQPAAGAGIPATVRDKAIRFDGLFAETPQLQPAEVWACEAWEPAWLASDRKTVRSFPGREDEYAEQVEELREIEPDLVFVDAGPAGSRKQRDARPAAAKTVTKKPWWKLW